MTAQLLVIYPPPADPQVFDRRYREEHLPIAGPKLVGATKVVTKRVLSPAGSGPAMYSMSEISFPSLAALEACASSQGGKEALAHAASISTGGLPLIVVVADETPLA